MRLYWSESEKALFERVKRTQGTITAKRHVDRECLVRLLKEAKTVDDLKPVLLELIDARPL